MKPHIMKTLEEKGPEEYYARIQNCVAGCKLKWKLMSKDLKSSFINKAKEQVEKTLERPRTTNEMGKVSKVSLTLAHTFFYTYENQRKCTEYYIYFWKIMEIS